MYHGGPETRRPGQKRTPTITAPLPKLPDQLPVPALLDAMSDEVAILDGKGVIVATNAAWNRFCRENGGEAANCYLGSNYLEVCRGAAGGSGTEAALVPEGLTRTFQTGEVFQCEYPCDSPNTRRWFELTANRLVLDSEPYLIVQHRNITQRRLEREAVERAKITANTLAALVATTSDAIISYDLEGNIQTWNRAAEKLYGYREEEVLGRSLELLYPPDWPHPITYYRDQIVAGRLERFEATRLAKDGTEREVWISGAPIRSESGEVVAISNIHRDVSEMRRAERARDLIAHEVVHRAKNMLTIVSSIQRQTARHETTLESFTQSFEARISALARSTDLLVKSAWGAIDLGALIAGHMEPFLAPGDTRLRQEGPAVTLRPQGVQTVGMALHELSTNAAKYGALASDEGQIEITWQLEAGDEGPALRLSWRESGGLRAAPRPEARGGFGATVLTKLAPSMLGAETDYEVTEAGVRWSILIPPAHVEQATPGAALEAPGAD